MSNHDRLETRLRAARATFGEVAAAPDAWQENQRRVAATRSSHRRRLLTAAAAVVCLLLVGGLALLGGQGPDSGPPASGGGSDDVWDSANVLGPSVVAETVPMDGTEVPHEIVLSDTSGDGPTLCDRLVATGSASGSCTMREPGADDPKVAVDWLSGSEGGGDLRAVLAGVDERVAFVEIWMTDGERVAAELHPTGWERTQMLAHTVPADGPRPQRLVATGRDGNVLQAVDLPGRFGDTWLVDRSACAGTSTASRPGTGAESADGVRVDLGTSDGLVTATDGDPACLEPLRGSALAAWTRIGDSLVVVTWPETKQVRVMAGQSLPAQQEPVAVKGSPLRVAVFTALGEGFLQRAEVVALDRHGIELDRAYVNQPKSP